MSAPGRTGRASIHSLFFFFFLKSHLLPDEVLQHRALPRTLAAHHSDLRQVQVRVLSDGGEGILHAVHQRNQILHSPVPHLCDAPGRLSIYLSIYVSISLYLYLSFLSAQAGRDSMCCVFSPRHPRVQRVFWTSLLGSLPH